MTPKATENGIRAKMPRTSDATAQPLVLPPARREPRPPEVGSAAQPGAGPGGRPGAAPGGGGVGPVQAWVAGPGMGTVLEVTKGLDVLTHSVFAWIEPYMTNIYTTTIVLYWSAFFYHFLLASEISMLGTSIPLVVEFAKSHGLDALWIGMVWTFAAGGKLFAYQSAPLIVGYAYGYFKHTDMLKLGAILTVVEFVMLTFCTGVWWPIFGF